MLRAIDRVFADHYQFYLYDSAFEHYGDPKLEWIEENRLAHGYLASEGAVYVSTVADLNDHRVRVHEGTPPPCHNWERVFKHTIGIPSGKLVISAIGNSPGENLSIDLESGDYLMTICADSIGKDLYSNDTTAERMDDEEYLARDDFEHYDIYLERVGT